MRRREFISFLGTASAAAWPRAARAQQPARMRRIGVLMSIGSDDPEGQNRLAAFLQGLQEFGWSVGRNIQIETRWGAGNRSLYRRYAGIAQVHRALIVRLATQHRLPSVFAFRTFVESGGLISYGPNLIEQYRQAAGYVDRILKGEKPGDLPVQMPTKYETLLNLKTAKALGLHVPDIVRLRADEVIE